MTEKRIRIGISGGTFDPIHYGHLIVAEEIRQKMQLDKVIFIPSGMPPHKKEINVTCAEHRYNMVCCAIENNPGFEVSRIEIDRTGYTYTINTLYSLKSMYRDNASLFFITGADVVSDLLSWKGYEKVFDMCEFIAVLRQGYNQYEFERAVNNLTTHYKVRIHTVDTPLIGISSTIIRERIRNNQSIRYLVPDKVDKYIRENGLYQITDRERFEGD